jgi:hypothetical protein
MAIKIRTFAPGDDGAQVSVYNEAAAALPKFKAATLNEVRRRTHAPDFDPATRFYAEENGQVVGYVTFQTNGRVSYPWCRAGHEQCAEPLLEAALNGLKARKVPAAFAAYRSEWVPQRDFFLRHGFRAAREMINYVLDFAEMPTPSARPSNQITPLTVEDVPAVLAMGADVLRVKTATDLEAYLFRNPWFPPAALFAHRGQASGPPLAVGLVVSDAAYAHPKQVDAAMPCFRLGAFGTEGMTTKRIKGLFSFLAAADQNAGPLALDLLNYATMLLDATDIETFAAQVPSDATPLALFYKQYFRRQGSFPVFELAL